MAIRTIAGDTVRSGVDQQEADQWVHSAFGRVFNSGILFSAAALCARQWVQIQRGSEMTKFAKSIKRFLVSEDGPTAVEYAVMLALIIVVCLAAISTLGTTANSKFIEIGNHLT